MTRAYRSPAADDGAVEITDKSPIRRKEMPIFISRRSKKRAPIPLAPQRHYSTRSPLSNRGFDPSTACKIAVIATSRLRLSNLDRAPRDVRRDRALGALPGGHAKVPTTGRALM